MSKRMLPPAWVDRIFARLDGVYGGEFAGKFSRVVGGRDEGIQAAKATWADELGGYADTPEAIAFALDVRNLPERAPNLVQFLGICKTAPRKTTHQLAHTPSDEERSDNRERIQAAAQAVKVGSGSKFTDWWQRILANPEKYPAISVEFAKEARKAHGYDRGAA
jgi:hypothetical protein